MQRRKTLFFKLSLWFLLITIASSAFQFSVLALQWQRHTDLLRQRIQWSTAYTAASAIQQALEIGDEAILRRKLADLSELKPGTDFWVLDANGKVLFGPFGKELARQVKKQDIEKFLAFEGYPNEPIYGIDPNPYQKTPVVFSVSSFSAGETNGYVYLVLNGISYNTYAQMLGQYTLGATNIYLTVITMGLTILLGVSLFFLLTRRFSRITSVLQRFEAGEYQQRVEDSSDDEIGVHARAFNAMAETVERSITSLQQTDRLRRQLTANASHELRRPLAVMRSVLELLQAKHSAVDAEERLVLIEKTMARCGALEKLVDELFELSKLESDDFTFEVESFPLEDLVSDVISRLGELARTKQIRISCENQPSLPFVLADMPLIDRLISNLTENAIRYTTDGGSVTISIRGDDQQITVAVADTGVGIPKEDLDNIFQRFYRTQISREMVSEGTGLGLAISKQIANAHGSELRVESEVGVGTTFSFDLEASEVR